MSGPVHFKGTKYASVEAMPPDVRAAYEKARQGLEQAQRGGEAGGRGMAGLDPVPPAPAWGGPRPQGSVPVPVEFDQVTGLGPAAAVYEHDGIQIFPNFGPPIANVAVRYHDGLAYRTKGKDIHILHWEEVAAIQSNDSRHSMEHGGFYTTYEYTLTKHDGEKLILDDDLKNVEMLIAPVKEAVFALIGPPLAQRYQAGEALSFGPVTVQRQNGLQMDGKLYAWDAIQDIKVESGRFKITLRDGKKHEVRTSAVPNIELLCQMIGLKMWSGNLAYY